MLSLPLRSAPTVQHHFAGASIAHTGIIVLEYVSTAGAVNEVSLHKAINLASGSHRTSAYLCHKPHSMQLRCFYEVVDPKDRARDFRLCRDGYARGYWN